MLPKELPMIGGYAWEVADLKGSSCYALLAEIDGVRADKPIIQIVAGYKDFSVYISLPVCWANEWNYQGSFVDLAEAVNHALGSYCEIWDKPNNFFKGVTECH